MNRTAQQNGPAPTTRAGHGGNHPPQLTKWQKGCASSIPKGRPSLRRFSDAAKAMLAEAARRSRVSPREAGQRQTARDSAGLRRGQTCAEREAHRRRTARSYVASARNAYGSRSRATCGDSEEAERAGGRNSLLTIENDNYHER